MSGKPDALAGEAQLLTFVAETRLWTIQPLEVWVQLQIHGCVHVDEFRLTTPGYVPDSYRWLVRQLEERLPNYPGTLPWWAHCRKPDLRWVRHREPASQRHLRIELEPPPGMFLTFRGWAWDVVFCGQYLSSARAEHDEWMEAMRQDVPDEDMWPLPEPCQSQLEASWLRLFDPDLPPKPWDDGAFCKTEDCEGVLGLLRLEDVRHVTEFMGCDRWRSELTG
jgi:hypothetical protein